MADMTRKALYMAASMVFGCAAILGCATIFGCAVGVTETGDSADGGAGPGGVGAGGFGGSDSSSLSSTGGQGGDMLVGGMGGAGGASTCVFDAPNTCAAAEQLPSVAGDESSPSVTRNGVTSKWYQIHVTEEVSSISSRDLSYTVTLTSASGADYDLIVHQSPQDSPPDCNATPKLGVDQGNGAQTVSDGWNDNQGIGGEDDPVWLSIEVRYVSGMDCTTAGQYTLTIQGNT